MSTTSTLPTTSAATVPSQARGVPFGRLLVVEMRKLVDTRAGMWLLIVIGLITTTVIALVLFTSDPDELTFQGLAFTAALPQSLLLPVLGVLTATSEWSQRTGLVTFTLEPRRLRVGAAKLTASMLVALAAVGLALAVGAFANLVGIGWLDGAGTWGVSAQVLLGGVLLQLLSVVQGVAFGAAIGNSAAAIVAIFALPTVGMLLSAMFDWVDKASRWVDLSVTSSPLLEGTMSSADWAPLGVSMGVWLVLPLAIGAYRLVRRDVA
jgi:ABC-2 type transport system permease protein